MGEKGEDALHDFDLLIRGGDIVTASDRMTTDLGISGERIVALGEKLGKGRCDRHPPLCRSLLHGWRKTLRPAPPKKGTIAIGSDADIAIWDPKLQVTVRYDTPHDAIGYCPYAGITLNGWPVTMLARGEVIIENGECMIKRGRRRLLTRAAGTATKPSNHLAPELDPSRNFGASII